LRTALEVPGQRPTITSFSVDALQFPHNPLDVVLLYDKVTHFGSKTLVPAAVTIEALNLSGEEVGLRFRQ
jgi:hypothetical protein